MPQIANITLTNAQVLEPVLPNNWAVYGSTASLNRTLALQSNLTPAGTSVITLKTMSPLSRTVEGVAVASGFNSSVTKFNFNSTATAAEREDEIQSVIDVLTLHKAALALGKTFY